jgi:hypothetical protein
MIQNRADAKCVAEYIHLKRRDMLSVAQRVAAHWL